ncbi:formylglycine-generating enzyme family protein [Paraflavitalea speifideaquila]|uniref:formylglycine-generating enzyme family protein n=1 Tax=Paraflavitalea speifideaquila TaxID=3076558 RepID=UPI0028E79871|nr:SUMF1/EgtB/PvdO family nonheme iron enzyme [Paraflavitalea speifideiaquila]
MVSCESNLPARFPTTGADTSSLAQTGSVSHEGMIWIAGSTYGMGAVDKEGRPDEYPQHTVTVAGFWIDATEVTNAQFRRFVEATGYITTAEKSPTGKKSKSNCRQVHRNLQKRYWYLLRWYLRRQGIRYR